MFLRYIDRERVRERVRATSTQYQLYYQVQLPSPTRKNALFGPFLLRLLTKLFGPFSVCSNTGPIHGDRTLDKERGKRGGFVYRIHDAHTRW